MIFWNETLQILKDTIRILQTLFALTTKSHQLCWICLFKKWNRKTTCLSFCRTDAIWMKSPQPVTLTVISAPGCCRQNTVWNRRGGLTKNNPF